MCTLIICRNAFRHFPLVVAANRDEEFERSAEPPRIWEGSPKMLAPVDPITGGTWWGVNEYGVIAAITNRRGYPHMKDTLMKRGELVPIALQSSRSADDALETICSFDGRMFNAFHLFFADCRGNAYLALGDRGKTIGDRSVPEGFQLVTDQGVGLKHSPRAVSIEEKFHADVSGIPPRPSSLGQLLDLHDSGLKGLRGDASCNHQSEETYETRSSSVIRMNDGPDGLFWEIWHREKPEDHPNCHGRWVRSDELRIIEPSQ